MGRKLEDAEELMARKEGERERETDHGSLWSEFVFWSLPPPDSSERDEEQH